MENQGNKGQLKAMYENRLQNLTAVIEKLHEQVNKDEALQNLQGQQMTKYRIDRVHELVREIMESQKQHMLIKVLEKLNEVNAKPQPKEHQNHLKILQTKNQELMHLRILISDLESQINMKDKQIKELVVVEETRQKSARKQEQQQVSIFENSLEKKNEEIKQLEKELKEAYQAFTKVKKDGEEAVKDLKQTVKILQEKLLQSEINVKKIAEEKSKLSTDQSARKIPKTQTAAKLEAMNQQIAFLEEELFEVGKNFTIIKDHALAETLTKIQKLKKNFHRDTLIIKQELQEFRSSFMNIVKQQMERFVSVQAKVSKSSQNQAKDKQKITQKVLLKMNQIDNQLTYFIENELIV